MHMRASASADRTCLDRCTSLSESQDYVIPETRRQPATPSSGHGPDASRTRVSQSTAPPLTLWPEMEAQNCRTSSGVTLLPQYAIILRRPACERHLKSTWGPKPQLSQAWTQLTTPTFGQHHHTQHIKNLHPQQVRRMRYLCPFSNEPGQEF